MTFYSSLRTRKPLAPAKAGGSKPVSIAASPAFPCSPGAAPRNDGALIHALPLFLLFAFLAACAVQPPAKRPDKLVLDRTEFSALPGWAEDRHAQAFGSFKNSCDAILARSDATMTGKGILELPTAEWKMICARAEVVPAAPAPAPEAAGYAVPLLSLLPTDEAAGRFFETEFVPYAVSNNGTREGLFTGYYEPLLRGSRTRQGSYRYPVYALPPDLVKGQPYFSRSEIEQGALRGKGLELAYVDNLADLFFLQIQGSGRLMLDTGEQYRLAYAGQNGHEYVALGRVMKDENLLPPDNISMFTIKEWLNTHPDEAVPLMWRNPSYVFFALQPAPADGSGPKGGQGVPLTPERSLAVDKAYFPYGLPVWLDTTVPVGAPAPYRRLMIAQDTGGAIKGPVRGDVFYGFGPEAELLAGNMKQRGQWTLLLPRALANRLGAHAE